MDIMMGLTAINSALQSVKLLRDIDKDIDTAQYKLAVADLTTSLADAKLALTDAADENRELLSQIEKLKESFAFGEELVEHKGYRYYPSDDGKPSGEPFCRVCERNDGKYFQLTPSKGMIQHTCPNCKSVFHHLPSFTTREAQRAEKERLAPE